MSKYITFLLVILAATGTEAQSIKSVVASTAGDFKFVENLSQEEMRAFGTDIMSLLKGLLLSVDNQKGKNLFSNKTYFAGLITTYAIDSKHCDMAANAQPKGMKSVFISTSVSIRAPNASC